MLYPRKASWKDCYDMAPRLRPEDRREVEAASGVPPVVSLLAAQAHPTWVGCNPEDRAVCMGGVIPEDATSARVWMVATTELEHHQLSFLRQSREWLERWNTEFPLLHNVVDERNALHLRWLRWLGFTFIRRIPDFGPKRLPFIEFVRTTPCVTP